jgi:hypothetical protein
VTAHQPNELLTALCQAHEGMPIERSLSIAAQTGSGRLALQRGAVGVLNVGARPRSMGAWFEHLSCVRTGERSDFGWAHLPGRDCLRARESRSRELGVTMAKPGRAGANVASLGRAQWTE